MSSNGAAMMPTDVNNRVGFFDRFAGHASDVASRASEETAHRVPRTSEDFHRQVSAGPFLQVSEEFR